MKMGAGFFSRGIPTPLERKSKSSITGQRLYLMRSAHSFPVMPTCNRIAGRTEGRNIISKWCAHARRISGEKLEGCVKSEKAILKPGEAKTCLGAVVALIENAQILDLIIDA